MLFGTVAGSLADTLGRKRGALAYVVVYAASCATKHWRSYNVLMIGRVLGGVATSLLFSVFDAWLVSEHTARGFEPPGSRRRSRTRRRVGPRLLRRLYDFSRAKHRRATRSWPSRRASSASGPRG